MIDELVYLAITLFNYISSNNISILRILLPPRTTIWKAWIQERRLVFYKIFVTFQLESAQDCPKHEFVRDCSLYNLL